MPTNIEVNLEALPGYRLIKHLGSGGYGEVWSAEAPGGLMKAIKFVFGNQHEKRASHELRALDRVRSVRHPFLLSLERIEVVDGRLLVVTELADGSLKDRFDDCRKRGLVGIPREDLIRFLRDAADALDFMINTHALGHLDIKPENLLLLADHVKVADFGLVKDVRQSQASLVGGMTPLYAAPEVFRGLPGSHSDQYSLAIVYQEMLIGTLPFTGASAAELTLKHLNDEPDLSPLPDGDRYVISRALAKDPAHRYGSCREFVDALAKVNNEIQVIVTDDSSLAIRHSSFTAAGQGANSGLSSSAACPTDVFEIEESDGGILDSVRMLIDAPARQAPMTDLPPVPLEANAAQPVPTLILGIGGAAGRVLAHFRRMLHEQFREAGRLPAIQTLLLETDAQAVAQLTRHDGTSLASDDTLTMPLQRPQHYREQSQQLLRWLSRRWLYNIPRSLRTEGLRPLGRLALTDHARQVGQRIRRGITQALEPDVLASSSRTLGREFRNDAVQVFVVASISGGTGGGMSLDIGYAVRAILERFALAKSNVTGVMLHATGGDARHCELARVNAFSWLTEFEHFQQPAVAYPGDSSCGFPPHACGVKAFDDTYLVHLGDNIDTAEFDSATRAVAEYLRLNILSPAKTFFEAHRADTASGDASQGRAEGRQMRSFGIFRRTSTVAGSCDRIAGMISQRVIAHWLQGRAQNSNESVGPMTDASPAETQLVRRLGLDVDGLFANMRALAGLHLQTDTATFLSFWLAQHPNPKSARDGSTFAAIDHIFSENAAQPSQSAAWLLGQPASTIVAPLLEKLRGEIRRWFVGRLDDPQSRLAGTRLSLDWLTSHLTSLNAGLRDLEQSLMSKLARAIEIGAGHAAVTTIAPIDYFNTRLDLLATHAAGHASRLLLSDMKVCADELIAIGRELDQLARSCAANLDEVDGSDENNAKLAAWLAPRLDATAEEVDQRLAGECLQEQGWSATIMQGGRRRAQLCATLNEQARQAAQQALNGVHMLNESAVGITDTAANLHSQLATATPALLSQGGTRRVLAILPRENAGENAAGELSKRLHMDVNTIVGDDNSMTLCVEAAGLPISDVAVELVQRRRDRVEFAGRVQSRKDIEWTPLVVESSEPQPSTWVDLAHTPAMPEQFAAKTMVLER